MKNCLIPKSSDYTGENYFYILLKKHHRLSFCCKLLYQTHNSNHLADNKVLSEPHQTQQNIFLSLSVVWHITRHIRTLCWLFGLFIELFITLCVWWNSVIWMCQKPQNLGFYGKHFTLGGALTVPLKLPKIITNSILNRHFITETLVDPLLQWLSFHIVVYTVCQIVCSFRYLIIIVLYSLDRT